MTFLAPLGLLFLLSVPVVVLFYLLRVRLRQVEVSSIYLWERLLRDLSAQDPWQKPRFTLLMLIQILLLGVLAFALARPAWQALAQESVFQIIVLDASASMQTVDVSPNRFAQARQLATESIQSLPPGSQVAIVAARNRPDVIESGTADRDAALAALDRIQPGSTVLNLTQALRLANAIATGHGKARVDVFTDGAFDWPDDLPDPPVPTRYHLVGGSSNNQAITAISARPDSQNNRRYQTFVRVHNFAPVPAAVTLGLYADGTLVDSRNVSLDASSSQELIFDRLPDDATVIEARLLTSDDLSVDNSATTVLERRRPTKVLLVTAGNIFLEHGLVALPDVEVFSATPRRYAGIDVEQYDLIVFDDYVPDSLPQHNLFLINPPDSAFLPVEGTLQLPAVTSWESASPLLRYVSFNDVRVRRASKVTVPGWAKTIVDSGGNPLVMAGDLRGQRFLILTFELQQSNLPLSATFPILIANAVGYLEPPGVLSDRTVSASTPVGIQPLPQAEEVGVEQPGGSVATFPAGRPVRYEQTDQVGLYTVQQKARGEVISTERFAVNLADDAESNVQPRFQGETAGQASAENGQPVPVQHEIWPWLVLGGLGLLTGEWWWYHRRA